jgi:hypothetical protein
LLCIYCYGDFAWFLQQVSITAANLLESLLRLFTVYLVRLVLKQLLLRAKRFITNETRKYSVLDDPIIQCDASEPRNQEAPFLFVVVLRGVICQQERSPPFLRAPQQLIRILYTIDMGQMSVGLKRNLITLTHQQKPLLFFLLKRGLLFPNALVLAGSCKVCM